MHIAVWAAGVGVGNGDWAAAGPFPMAMGPDGPMPPFPAAMLDMFDEGVFPPPAMPWFEPLN